MKAYPLTCLECLILLPSVALSLAAQETYPPPATSTQKIERPKIDPAKEVAIRRLMATTGDKEQTLLMMRQMLGEMNKMLDKELPPDPRAREFSRRMQDKMLALFERDFDGLMEQFTAIWAEHLTVEELDGLVAFYESPLGRKTREIMPKVMAELPRILIPWQLDLMKELRDEIEKEFPQVTNETAAQQALQTIQVACETFVTTYPDGGYPATLAELGPDGAGMIDAELASGTITGYTIEYNARDSDGDGVLDTFRAQANPTEPGVTGYRYFFMNEGGVLRASYEGPATAISQVVQ